MLLCMKEKGLVAIAMSWLHRIRNETDHGILEAAVITYEVYVEITNRQSSMDQEDVNR